MTARRWQHAGDTLANLLDGPLVLWLTREQADGWPTHTPGAGIPGGGAPGSISDRTMNAAMRRHEEDERTDTLGLQLESVARWSRGAMQHLQDIAHVDDDHTLSLTRITDFNIARLAETARLSSATVALRWRDCSDEMRAHITEDHMPMVDLWVGRIARTIMRDITVRIEPARMCDGWGPWASDGPTPCEFYAVSRYADPASGATNDDGVDDGLCDRCRRMKAFRCGCGCGKGIDAKAITQRPIRGDMLAACYERMRREEAA